MLLSAFPAAFILQTLLVPSLFSSYTVAQQHPLHVASSLLFGFSDTHCFPPKHQKFFFSFLLLVPLFMFSFGNITIHHAWVLGPLFLFYFMFFLYILLNSSNSSSKTNQSFFISLFPSSLRSTHQQVSTTITLKHFLTSASFYLREYSWIANMTQELSLSDRFLGFESPYCPYLAIRPQPSYIISFFLSLLICKMKTVVPTSGGHWGIEKSLTHVRCLLPSSPL